MNQLEANLAAIEQYSPRTAAAIRAAHSYAEFIEPTSDGDFTLKSEGPEGQWIHSRRAPVAEAKRIISEIAPKHWQTLVVSGIGTGLLPQLLLEAFPERRVLVLEHDPALLRTVLERRDFTKAIERRDLVIACPAGGEHVGTSVGAALQDVLVYGHVPVAHRYALGDARHDALLTQLLESLKAAQNNLSTAFVNNRVALSNNLANLPKYQNSSGFGLLRGVLAGSPAVLVAAGPSLARNLHVLKQYSGKIHTHAVSSALKRVLAEGIEVHSGNVIDYHHLSVRYFDGIRGGPLLVAKPSCHPGVVAAYDGPVVVSGSQFYQRMFGSHAADPVDAFDESSNVAHHAYLLLRFMGASPIILMGLDQANSFHITHIPGTAYYDTLAASSHRFASLEMNELLWVTSRYDVIGEDIHGIPLTADPQMTDSATRFEQLFAKYPADVINATEGGRRLDGARDMTAAEALAAYAGDRRVPSPIPDSARLSHTSAADPSPAEVLSRLSEYVGRLRDGADLVAKTISAALGAMDAGKKASDPQPAIDTFNSLIAESQDWFSLVATIVAADTFQRRRARQAAMDPSLSPEERLRIQLRSEGDYANAIVHACDSWTAQAAGGESAARCEYPPDIAPTSHIGSPGAGPRIDAFIQLSGVPEIDAAFIGDPSFSPLERTLSILCSHDSIGRVMLDSEVVTSFRHPKLNPIRGLAPLPYPAADDAESLFGWNHCGTLRGLGMSTMVGAEGSPFAFLEAQSAFDDPAPHCLVVTSHTGFLTAEAVDALIGQAESTQWASPLWLAEGPRGLTPVLYSRGAMLNALESRDLPHLGFLRTGTFWGAPFAPLPSSVVRCRRDFSLSTPRSRGFAVAVAKKLGFSVRPGVPLAEIVAAGESCHAENTGQVPRDIELEITTERGVNPRWLPRLKRTATMTADQANVVFAQLRPHKTDVNVTIGGHGDPLLHPDWREIVTAARACSARLNLRTFGTSLRQTDIREMRSLGVDVLTVRLGVWGRELYLAENGVDAFDAIVTTLREARAESATLNRQVLHIVPEVVKSMEGDRTLRAFRDEWYSPFTWPNVVDFNTWDGALAERQAIPLYPAARTSCIRLSEQMVIHADGSVPVCSQDYEAERPAGNAFTTPLTKIWCGPAFTAARAAHRDGDWNRARTQCGSCNQWFRLT